jgi:hypothetical protein
MRIFNKHYKAAPRKNPTSKLVRNIGKKFERLLAENPQKYREVFKEAFGKHPLPEGSEHDPLAELYEAIGKRATEEKKLRELERLFPGAALDPKSELAARRLVRKIGALDQKLSSGLDTAEEAHDRRELLDERAELNRQLDEIREEMVAPAKELKEQQGKVARSRRAEEKLKAEDEGRQRLMKKRSHGRRPFRYGEDEASRMEELEAQSRKEMSGKKATGHRRKAAPLGEAFQIEESGFRGIIQPPDPSQIGLFGEGFTWSLHDPQDELLLSGTSKTHSSASQAVKIAFETMSDLANGVDLDHGRKQWLRGVNKGPGFNRWVLRAKAEMERGIMRRFKRGGIAGAGKGFQTYESRTRAVARKFKRPVELELGEEERAMGQDYTVIVRRDMEGYWTKVVTKVDPELGKSFDTGWAGPFSGSDGIEKAYRKGEVIGAQLTGAREFIVANPTRRKSMSSSARRVLAKSNPKLERDPLSGEEKFRDIESSIGIPDDPDQAYRVGYAWGVIRGIDTCGVQNFLKRKKIRKQYEKQILDAYKQIARSATEPIDSDGRSSRMPRTVG